MGADRARFAAAEQPHRAAGEDAAVALEVGSPGLVVDLVGQDLADVDRGRVHRIDQQRRRAGEVLAVLLALLLAGLLDMRFERRAVWPSVSICRVSRSDAARADFDGARGDRSTSRS